MALCARCTIGLEDVTVQELEHLFGDRLSFPCATQEKKGGIIEGFVIFTVNQPSGQLDQSYQAIEKNTETYLPKVKELKTVHDVHSFVGISRDLVIDQKEEAFEALKKLATEDNKSMMWDTAVKLWKDINVDVESQIKFRCCNMDLASKNDIE
ncbi:hypothetical protein PROFUN_08714 [Planoprotostelium fungivorum]|uniref:Uncharacterized protein n=1 Tax=Planoprotostelium fungivorum TaxID=1890364 RepID=A0A2P6MQW6_9EUKA|nr:hypothetical protein PROFUN_08714 [Planoprotostelium fungivorum]